MLSHEDDADVSRAVGIACAEPPIASRISPQDPRRKRLGWDVEVRER